MTSLVPVADLARELGPFDESDTERAAGFLEEASELARELGRLAWTDTEGAYPAPVRVRLVVKAAARRAFVEDPEGYASESLGDWTGRKTAGELDEVGVFFTPSEEAKVRIAAGKAAGAYSVRTPSAYAATAASTLYAPVSNPSGSPIPLLAAEEVYE